VWPRPPGAWKRCDGGLPPRSRPTSTRRCASSSHIPPTGRKPARPDPRPRRPRFRRSSPRTGVRAAGRARSTSRPPTTTCCGTPIASSSAAARRRTAWSPPPTDVSLARPLLGHRGRWPSCSRARSTTGRRRRGVAAGGGHVIVQIRRACEGHAERRASGDPPHGPTCLAIGSPEARAAPARPPACEGARADRGTSGPLPRRSRRLRGRHDRRAGRRRRARAVVRSGCGERADDSSADGRAAEDPAPLPRRPRTRRRARDRPCITARRSIAPAPGKRRHERADASFEALLEFLSTPAAPTSRATSARASQRRFRRRMDAVGCESFGDYLDYLEVTRRSTSSSSRCC
jgi:hypothetical protein